MITALAGPGRDLDSDHVLSYTEDGKTLVCVRREVIPVFVVKLSDKGQLVIPSEIRAKYDLSKGDRFLVRDVGGKIVLEPLPRYPLLELRGAFKLGAGAVDLLLRERENDRIREDDNHSR
jgi:AbrB family looped-hinge helix DNA binding protein